MRRSTTSLSLSIAAAALAASPPVLRAWLRHWGATDDERIKALPGDELIANVRAQSTMAVTIDAPPESVWPWLVQMGVDRAGLYTYLFVENTLLRLGVSNADRIVLEWQDLRIGDHIWFTPEGYPTPRMGPVVTRIDPNRALVLCHEAPGQTCPGTWQFVLERMDDGATRLLFRERSSRDQGAAWLVMNYLLEPGYLVMERGMLKGIKTRVERAA